MDPNLFYIAEGNPALRFASEYLAEKECRIADAPDKSVTHLLLPVPSFEPDGRIKGGGILERGAAAGQWPHRSDGIRRRSQ